MIRGFRVARTLRIWPKHLKAAADSAPDPEGDGGDSDKGLVSIPAGTQVRTQFNFSRSSAEISKYQDPLQLLLSHAVEVTTTPLRLVFVVPDHNVTKKLRRRQLTVTWYSFMTMT